MKLIDNYNENLEKFLTAIFGIIGIIAILINVHLKGYGTEDWLDAIKDIASLIIVVAVFLVAMRNIRNSETHYSLARGALQNLQSKYPIILMGPRYNRDSYDPEKGKGLEYLFVTNENKKSSKRTKFIPVQPLEEGLLYVYISAQTLADALNRGNGNVADEEINKIKSEIFSVVKTVVDKNYPGLFSVVENIKDSAIIIDFEESNMRKKQFAKAIYDCTEAATKKLLEFRKPK